MPTAAEANKRTVDFGNTYLKPLLSSEPPVITKEQFKEILKSVVKSVAASYKGEALDSNPSPHPSPIPSPSPGTSPNPNPDPHPDHLPGEALDSTFDARVEQLLAAKTHEVRISLSAAPGSARATHTAPQTHWPEPCAPGRTEFLS